MTTHSAISRRLTLHIIIAMISGILVGLALHQLPKIDFLETYLVEGLLDSGGKIFITALKMLVVPIVFVSLVCGTCNLGDSRKFGRLALKSISLYLFTTALAISLALFVASLFQIGHGTGLTPQVSFNPASMPSLKQTLLNIVPSNPFAALASGNMLQVIVFAIMFGIAITMAGEAGERTKALFKSLESVVMNLMTIVISIAPYGVFCLVAHIFAQLGFGLIAQLFGYFGTVLCVLFMQLFFTYPALLHFLGKLSPRKFLRKMLPAMLFAFSTSSSNASIPVVLETVEHKLGVKNSIAAFIVPLGATINMDGTAIMQGVATVFIANTYAIHLGMIGFLKIILTATLASIGTAGIPSVGLITLTMVLVQAGLPVEGIALIIGVDRLLDMTRTAVNITGDSTIACIVASSEQALDKSVFENQNSQ